MGWTPKDFEPEVFKDEVVDLVAMIRLSEKNKNDQYNS